MASRHSKKTLALKAQFPVIADWIINNLTPDQLIVVMESSFNTLWFGEDHPLNSQELGVQLWRAYRNQVVFELECLWGEDRSYALAPVNCDRFVYFHAAVCVAVGNYAREQSELMDGIVERQRREIEASTGPAQPIVGQSGAGKRQNRL